MEHAAQWASAYKNRRRSRRERASQSSFEISGPKQVLLPSFSYVVAVLYQINFSSAVNNQKLMNLNEVQGERQYKIENAGIQFLIMGYRR